MKRKEILNAREKYVWELWNQGFRSKKISKILGITTREVMKILIKALNKLKKAEKESEEAI